MKRTAALATVVLLFTMCRTAPVGTGMAARQTGYTSRAGELAVGVIPAGTLADEQRGRRLDLMVEYPIQEGSYPVIVFSTGFGAPSRTYVPLSSYWASHGYVVIKVGHPETRPDVAEPAQVWQNQTTADFRNRTRDITFVLDSFAQLEQQYPELAGKLDASRVGVGGHSYGAFVTMLLAGARTFSGDTPTAYADPRIRAALAMSPQGPSQGRGLTAESWREVEIPIMYMTGSLDEGITEAENEEWRRQAFELSPAGDKWFVAIIGARHLTFSGRLPAPTAGGVIEPDAPLPGEPRDPRDPRYRPRVPQPGEPRVRRDLGFYSERQLMNTIRTVSLAFWDAYLKEETAGREFLSGLTTRGDMTVLMK